MYVCTHIHIHTQTHVYVYIYIDIYKYVSSQPLNWIWLSKSVKFERSHFARNLVSQVQIENSIFCTMSPILTFFENRKYSRYK